MDGHEEGVAAFDDNLSSVAQSLARKKNIVVLAGAGISVSCGIPDFRSPTGLYRTLNYQVRLLASCRDGSYPRRYNLTVTSCSAAPRPSR